MNLTTRADAVAALRAHYMPELLKVEDFEAFESIVASNGKSLLAGMMAACLAGFDESLRGSMPRGWSAHHRARRKLATLVGPVEFERTVFVDELGRRRALLDELLSIPPRSRLSPGAFLWLVGRAAEVMQKVCRAFPEGPRREWAAGLARRGRPLQLARMSARVLPKIKDPKRRDRVRDLRGYMLNNADCVVFPKETMGTMEGTNAYVGAARMKGRGMSWSRKGAEAMCLVRCALAEGRPLVAPKFPALYSKKEERAAEKFLAKSLSRGPESCGSGWAPPHQATTWAMKSNARFRAGSC